MTHPLSARPLVHTITAVFFWLLVVGPLCLMVIPSMVHVPGDPTATAEAIGTHETWVRAGMVGELSIAVSEVAMATALALLFRRTPFMAGLIGASRLGMAAIQGVAVVPLLTALQARADPDLALLAMDVHAQAAFVWQGFFGLHCLVLGLAILRTPGIPRLLGWGMFIAGLAYTLQSLGMLAAPGPVSALQGPLTIGMLCEIPFFIWLMVRGVPTFDGRTAPS